ncbi:uncharacterized protein LOC141851028 [Brevipalpus obovatus]|uniref:uncharacterized protein LOC141851028 n=1 Tax=Brevipalpus obovatus TaxID=246614 RepID=UPI003D9F9EB3
MALKSPTCWILNIILWLNLFQLDNQVKFVSSDRVRLLSHVRHRIQRRASVIGTFRFDQLNGRNRGRQGWNVSGCYCPVASLYCDCSQASNRVQMFVKKQRQNRNRSARKVKYRSRKKNASGSTRTTTLRIRSGCFCDRSGCRGLACSRMNGCVCNRRGRCWGNKCPSVSERSELMTSSANDDRHLGDKISPQERFLNAHYNLNDHKIYSDANIPLSIEDAGGGGGGEILLDAANLTELFNLSDDGYGESLGDHTELYHPRLTGENANMMSESSNDNGCLCESDGECHGSVCDQMEGCVCSHTRCWGRLCNGDEGEGDFGTLQERLLSQNEMRNSGKEVAIGQSVQTSSGGPFGSELLNDKVTLISDKFGDLMSELESKKGILKAKINMLGGKFGGKMKMIQPGKGEKIKSTPGQIIEDTKGTKIESVAGKEIKTLSMDDVHLLKQLSGQTIPVVKGYPIDSIVGYPITSLDGVEISSLPAEPLKIVPGNPISKVPGLKIEKITGHKIPKITGHKIPKITGHKIPRIQANPMKQVIGHQIGQIIGSPVKTITSAQIDVKKIPGNHVNSIVPSPVHTIVGNPMKIISSQGPIKSVPIHDWSISDSQMMKNPINNFQIQPMNTFMNSWMHYHRA